MQGFNKSVCPFLLLPVPSTHRLTDTIPQIMIHQTAVSTNIEVWSTSPRSTFDRSMPRQTCPGRQSPKVGSRDFDRSVRTSLQHLVVSGDTPPCGGSIIRTPAAHATITLAWESATTRKRRRSETTTALPYSPLDANVICAMAGLKYKPTPRSASCECSYPTLTRP